MAIQINLNAIMKKKRYSVRELHKETGLAESTISRMKNNKTKSIDLVTLNTLTDCLEIEPGEMFKKVRDNA